MNSTKNMGNNHQLLCIIAVYVMVYSNYSVMLAGENNKFGNYDVILHAPHKRHFFINVNQ